MQVIYPISYESLRLPLYVHSVQAGFPSPAEDHTDLELDLNDYLISKPTSTFFVRASGDSMINVGILQGSLLVVDRSKEAVNNKIVIAVVNGEFTVKRLVITKGSSWLMAENNNYPPIKLDNDAYVWGVVTAVINKF